ncbi:MAG TPA: 23S rRNA (adenine(2503)-C(2))-methyltransferase RlmN [Thermoanaerobaculia bacterium]
MTNEPLPNLYDFAPARLEQVVGDIVSPAFRVKQIAEWLHVRGVESFDAMSNIPKDVRAKLAEHFVIEMPQVVERTAPAVDGSQKYLLTLRDGNRIESVYMPMRDRTSICLSSQAGCAVGCTFCVTGFFGAGRNLTPSEMLGQFFIVQHEKAIATEQMNVVFMGMGEPLLNFEHLVTTLEILYKNIAPKRITVSTSGIIPGLDDLARLTRRPNLAVSINAPDRERREEIMPITKKYPLDELMAALRRFPLEKNREMTIEYVLLAGYNDSPADARALARLIRGLPAKVNAIPFNEDANLPSWMKRPGEVAIDRFADALVHAGARVTVRRSKGREIAAACGQLRGKTEAPRHRRSLQASAKTRTGV